MGDFGEKSIKRLKCGYLVQLHLSNPLVFRYLFILLDAEKAFD